MKCTYWIGYDVLHADSYIHQSLTSIDTKTWRSELLHINQMVKRVCVHARVCVACSICTSSRLVPVSSEPCPGSAAVPPASHIATSENDITHSYSHSRLAHTVQLQWSDYLVLHVDPLIALWSENKQFCLCFPVVRSCIRNSIKGACMYFPCLVSCHFRLISQISTHRTGEDEG